MGARLHAGKSRASASSDLTWCRTHKSCMQKLAAQAIFFPTISRALSSVTSATQGSKSLLQAKMYALANRSEETGRVRGLSISNDSNGTSTLPMPLQEIVDIKLWKKLCRRAFTDTASTRLQTTDIVLDGAKRSFSHEDASLLHDVEPDMHDYVTEPVLLGWGGGRLHHEVARGAGLREEASRWHAEEADEWLMDDIDEQCCDGGRLP